MELQFNLNLDDKTEVEIKLDILQKQIDAIEESTGKVRRKLFAELGELKKICGSLQIENETLKSELLAVKNVKNDWQYLQSYTLVDKCG